MSRSQPLVASLAAVVLLALAAVAWADARLDEGRELVEAARPFYRQTANTELDHSERKAARREAYIRLKQARKLFDSYIDEHESEMEALDGEYVEMSSMLFWLKKDAGISEFDDIGSKSSDLPKASDGPKPAPPKPAPPKAGDEPGGDGTGGDGPGPDTKPAPEPPEETPEQALARRSRDTYEAIQDAERETPGDLPRLHEMYEKFLAEFDDPTLPEYTKAAMRLGAITDRMKEVYKREAAADPDAIKNVDSKETGRIIARLSKSLNSSETDEQHNAARLLGGLGTGAASYPLVRAMRSRDPELSKIAADGLVALGGTRTAFNITKTFRNAKEELQLQALDVLVRIAQKGPVDAKATSVPIGRFALSPEGKVAKQAMDALAALGEPGGPGLVEALGSKLPLKKKYVIERLADAKYYEASTEIGNYLLLGDGRATRLLRAAAYDALRKMGKPAVPGLIQLLKSRKHRGHTLAVMRELSGQTFSARETKKWREWCDGEGL